MLVPRHSLSAAVRVAVVLEVKVVTPRLALVATRATDSEAATTEGNDAPQSPD
jgi:hypothetical protein